MSSNNDDDDDFTIQTWNPLRLLVLRLGLTEPAMTSPLNYGKYDGEFVCAYCGASLFDANAKYESGWPSFWRTQHENAVSYKLEWDNRLECRCQRCSSHLGHVLSRRTSRPETVAPEFVEKPSRIGSAVCYLLFAAVLYQRSCPLSSIKE